jgi:hypothetical protein
MEIDQNLMKDGNQRIVEGFRKRGLNPQDLRTIRRTQEWNFHPGAYSSRTFPHRTKVKFLDLYQ